MERKLLEGDMAGGIGDPARKSDREANSRANLQVLRAHAPEGRRIGSQVQHEAPGNRRFRRGVWFPPRGEP